MSNARYAIIQSLSEVALGSVIHSLRLPLGGHLLSINQFAVLTWAAHATDSRRSGISACVNVSNAAAFLKALSPAGKRLTPMLAISVQGMLYSTGIALFGPTLAGACFGAALASIWAFAQPLLVAYFIIGQSLFAGVEKLWIEFAQLVGIPSSVGLKILGAGVLMKIMASIAAAALAWKSGATLQARYLEKLEALANRALPRPKLDRAPAPFKGALRDLMQPWFLASLALSAGFFLISADPDWVSASWVVLRGGALGLLTFWAIRAVPRSSFHRLLNRFPRLASAVAQASRELSRT